MRGDTELQHPQPQSVIQSDCQSLSEIPDLFTLVLLTRVRVCICVFACVRPCVRVYPQAIDLGEVTVWRGPLSVAQ